MGNSVNRRQRCEAVDVAHLGFDILGVVLAIDVTGGSLVFESESDIADLRREVVF